jgi:hypothetical protein
MPHQLPQSDKSLGHIRLAGRLTVVLGLALGSLAFSSSFDLGQTFHVLSELVRLARRVHLLVVLGGLLFLGRFPAIEREGRVGSVA